MDGPVLIALIVATPPTIAAIGALAIGIRNARRADEAADKAALAAEKAAEASGRMVLLEGQVFEVGQRIDGRLTELLAASSALARAEGVVQGRSEREIP